MEGPRAVKPEEMESLFKLVDIVFRKSDSGEMMRKQFPLLFSPDNACRLRVFVDGGKVVSHLGYVVRDISVYGCTFTVGCIGSVATYEEYRGRGLATQLLYDAMERFREEGGDFFFISGGRGLYRRNGAVWAGEYEVVECTLRRMEEAMPFQVDVSLEEMTDDSKVEALARIHVVEPVRYVRPLGDWKAYFESDMSCKNTPSRLFVCHGPSGETAYIIVSREPDEEGVVKVLEYAGNRLVVCGGILSFLRNAGEGVSKIRIPVYRWDGSMKMLTAALSSEKINLPFTARIVSLERTIGKMRPLVAALRGEDAASSVTAEDRDLNGFVLNTPEGSVEMDAESAASVVFSGTNVPSSLVGVLPLAVPDYGINYI